ncbi:MAG TPA: hypothetical protein VM348_06130 [Brevundimonas sp.]|nr:hypothetical protein [Brevundimonas sp.]
MAARFGRTGTRIAVFPILATLFLAGPSLAQDPRTPAPQESGATDLGDVLVEGRTAREAAQAFVRSVAEPVRGRKAARWRDSVCVGVGGMQGDAARFMVDRISDWAARVGLEIGPPGCQPQILIVATDDGDATARALVAARPREFRTGVSQSDQGEAALAAFQSSGRPIRWWHVSLPVDGTGAPIRRLPGQQPFTAPDEIQRPADLGPYGMIVSASRLTDETADDLMQAIIVLDTDAFDQADFVQVTDYIAMVALAQIDPDADPATPSILRLFKSGEAHEEMLTRWDQAYLAALYRTSQMGAGAGSNLSAIAGGLARDLEGRDGPEPSD